MSSIFVDEVINGEVVGGREVQSRKNFIVRDFLDNPAATLTSTKKKKRAGPSEDSSASDEGLRDKEAERIESVGGESGGDAKPDVSKVAASTPGWAEVAFSL